PGAKAVIFTSGTGGVTDYENADIVVQPLPNGPRRVVQKNGYYGRYVRSGHLVYMHEGTLFAAPFDVNRLEVTGPPVPAVEAVVSTSGNGGVQFAASDTGTAVYVSGQGLSSTSPFGWVDRTGKASLLRNTPADWSNPSFSRD